MKLRTLSMILAIFLLCGIFTVSAYAADEENATAESRVFIEGERFVMGELANITIGIESTGDEIYSGILEISYPNRNIKRTGTEVNTQIFDDYYDAYENDAPADRIIFEFDNQSKPLPDGKTELLKIDFLAGHSIYYYKPTEDVMIYTPYFVFEKCSFFDKDGNVIESIKVPDLVSFEIDEGGYDISESVLIGDCDFSGDVNVKDATLVQKRIAGLVETFDGKTMFVANVEYSDGLNIKDATAIQKHCVGIGANFIGCITGYIKGW